MVNMPRFVCLPLRKLVFDLQISIKGSCHTGQIQTCRAEIAADGDVGGRLAVCCPLPASVSVGNSLESLSQSTRNFLSHFQQPKIMRKGNNLPSSMEKLFLKLNLVKLTFKFKYYFSVSTQ